MFYDNTYLDNFIADAVGTPVTTDILFQSYLTDSDVLMNSLISDVQKGGQKILLDAGCGCGKTYFILNEFAKYLYMLGYKTVLAAPNAIQAMQNMKYGFEVDGQMHGTSALTGSNAGTGFWANGLSPVCAVYDCIGSRYGIISEEDKEKIAGILPDGNLDRHTVLIIDEAQDLYLQKNFRNKAISGIYDVERKVINAGGTVIYMSGTTKAISKMFYNHIYHCRKTDADGNVIPSFKGKRIRVYVKADNQQMLDDSAAKLQDAVAEGYKPFVLMNDKAKMRVLVQHLRNEGLSVLFMTSDDKGYHVSHELDGDDPYAPEVAVRKYDNELYGSTVEQGVLPDADIYLTTSLVEAGTSIIGVCKDGKITQPENILPVYIELKRNNCNIDRIEQFFNRIRFSVNQCAVMIALGDEAGVVDLDDRIDRQFKNEIHDGLIASAGIDRQDRAGMKAGKFMRDVTGRRSIDYLAFNNGHFEVPVSFFYGRACCEGYKAVTCNRASFQKALSDRFHCEVVFEDMSSVVKVNRDDAVPVDQDTVALLKEQIKNDEFKQALTDRTMNYSKGVLKKIIAAPDGKKLCAAYRKMERSIGKVYGLTDDQLIDAAAVYVVNPKAGFETDDFSCDRLDHAEEDALIKRTGGFTTVQAVQVSDVSSKESFWAINPEKDLNSLTDEQQDLVMDLIHNSCKFNAACNYYSRLQMADKTGCSWADAIGSVLGKSAGDLRWDAMRLNALVFNDIEMGTKEYVCKINAEGSVAGAHYHILRNGFPADLTYVDPKFDRKYPNADDAEKTAHMISITKFEGKTLSCYDFAALASSMNAATKRACHLRNYSRNITTADMKHMTECVYQCKDVTDDEKVREAYNVAPDDKKFYAVQIGGLRHQEKLKKGIDVKYLAELFDEADKIMSRNISARDKAMQLQIIYNQMRGAGVANKIARKVIAAMRWFFIKGKHCFEYAAGTVRRIYDAVTADPDKKIEEYGYLFTDAKQRVEDKPIGTLTKLFCRALNKDQRERWNALDKFQKAHTINFLEKVNGSDEFGSGADSTLNVLRGFGFADFVKDGLRGALGLGADEAVKLTPCFTFGDDMRSVDYTDKYMFTADNGKNYQWAQTFTDETQYAPVIKREKVLAL